MKLFSFSLRRRGKRWNCRKWNNLFRGSYYNHTRQCTCTGAFAENWTQQELTSPPGQAAPRRSHESSFFSPWVMFHCIRGLEREERAYTTYYVLPKGVQYQSECFSSGKTCNYFLRLITLAVVHYMHNVAWNTTVREFRLCHELCEGKTATKSMSFWRKGRQREAGSLAWQTERN